MSGLFQRIANRPAESPGDARSPEQRPDAPTQQVDAVTPDPPAESSPDAAPQVAPEQTDPPQVAPPPVRTLTPDTTLTPEVEAPTAVQPVVAEPAPAEAAAPAPDPEPAPAARAGFRERGRMRRRLRYLRRLRELQVRDLGGLVFDLRRFERKRDDLVAQKLDHIRACDDELRALELALDERRELREVREPGIGGTCPRCFAIHGSTDRFCASCGAALGGAVQGPAQVPPAPPPSVPPPAAPAPDGGADGAQQ